MLDLYKIDVTLLELTILLRKKGLKCINSPIGLHTIVIFIPHNINIQIMKELDIIYELLDDKKNSQDNTTKFIDNYIDSKILNINITPIDYIDHCSYNNDNNELSLDIYNASSDKNKNKYYKKISILKNIDWYNSTTNNPHETLNYMGIGAAYIVMKRELDIVIKQGGSYINYSHIKIVLDLMTLTGRLLSFNRFGVAKLSSLLERVTFEVTLATIAESTIRGEIDKLKSPISRMIVGQKIKGGTGIMDIIPVIDKIKTTTTKGVIDKKKTIIKKVTQRDKYLNTPNPNIHF